MLRFSRLKDSTISSSFTRTQQPVKLELMVESFNLLNRNNHESPDHAGWFSKQLDQLVRTDKAIRINIFPAQYRVPSSFLRVTDAYAPRQIQLALKLIY